MHLSAFSLLAQQVKYVKVMIQEQDIVDQKSFFGLIDVESLEHIQNGFLAVLPENDLNTLQNYVSKFDILDHDLAKTTEQKLTNAYLEFQKNRDLEPRTGGIPKAFNYGTLSGYFSLSEIISELDSMYLNYPNLVSKKEVIGTSYEGRNIYAVKISAPSTNKNKAQVLYTALHHSREPISFMQLIYFMEYLMENYEYDLNIKCLLDNRELYFIPVVNPDGYVYNETTNPQGGGYWRKNKKLNRDSTIGVDLNRNYGYKWGIDDNGSSKNPSSEIYRGDSAFSENETKAIRNFCINHHFKNALNYHTFSNLLLYPWGYEPDYCNDNSYYAKLAGIYTLENKYGIGPVSTTLYLANGGSDDWMYGDSLVKNKIFAMSPEVGDESWPPIKNIIPLAKKCLPMNISHAKYAGSNISVKIDSIYQSAANRNIYLGIHIQNDGISSDTLKVTLKEKNGFINNVDTNLYIKANSVTFYKFRIHFNREISLPFNLELEVQSKNKECYNFSETASLKIQEPLNVIDPIELTNLRFGENEMFVESDFDKMKLEIYDLLGRQILTIPEYKSATPISISELPKGNYFVKITSRNSIKSIQFFR